VKGLRKGLEDGRRTENGYTCGGGKPWPNDDDSGPRNAPSSLQSDLLFCAIAEVQDEAKREPLLKSWNDFGWPIFGWRAGQIKTLDDARNLVALYLAPRQAISENKSDPDAIDR
jgi:hypothetical protein